jgi:hypothetical protein
MNLNVRSHELPPGTPVKVLVSVVLVCGSTIRTLSTTAACEGTAYSFCMVGSYVMPYHNRTFPPGPNPDIDVVSVLLVSGSTMSTDRSSCAVTRGWMVSNDCQNSVAVRDCARLFTANDRMHETLRGSLRATWLRALIYQSLIRRGDSHLSRSMPEPSCAS